jgi:hypothetical protein
MLSNKARLLVKVSTHGSCRGKTGPRSTVHKGPLNQVSQNDTVAKGTHLISVDAPKKAFVQWLPI